MTTHKPEIFKQYFKDLSPDDKLALLSDISELAIEDNIKEALLTPIFNQNAKMITREKLLEHLIYEDQKTISNDILVNKLLETEVAKTIQDEITKFLIQNACPLDNGLKYFDYSHTLPEQVIDKIVWNHKDEINNEAFNISYDLINNLTKESIKDYLKEELNIDEPSEIYSLMEGSWRVDTVVDDVKNSISKYLKTSNEVDMDNVRDIINDYGEDIKVEVLSFTKPQQEVYW